METAGYIASVLIGVTLGLIGGGGSILTVPVLVYLFHIETVLATGYSLFIVGITSALGSVSYFIKDLVNVKTAILFGFPSILAVFATRAYLVPSLPDIIIETNHFTMSKSMMIMLIFAGLMIAASFSMIRKENKPLQAVRKNTFAHLMIPAEGILVGMLTGLVGAGGGFLIIPALVIWSKLPMREAIGTSLLIIAAKSLIGFWGESVKSHFDWPLLFRITLFAAVGILLGILLSAKIDGNKLKPAFGWFTLLMGVYILLNEIIAN